MTDKFKPGDCAIDVINNHEVVVLRRLPPTTYEVMRPFDSDGSWHQPYAQGVWNLRKKSEFKVGDKVWVQDGSSHFTAIIKDQDDKDYLIDPELSCGPFWVKKKDNPDLTMTLMKDAPMKFQVGDKVRSIVGTVSAIHNGNKDAVEVTWDDTRDNADVNWIYRHRIELVERPRKEPKLGSVWRYKSGGSPYQKGPYVYIGSGRYYKANEPGIYTDMDLANSSEWEEVTNNDNA